MSEAKPSQMTVKQAIDILSVMPDKGMMLMVDCPHCGRGSQLAEIEECIILKSKAGEVTP